MMISVTEAAIKLGLTVQGTYDRIRTAGVQVELREFGPGKKGYIKRADLAKVSKARRRGRPRKEAA